MDSLNLDQRVENNPYLLPSLDTKTKKYEYWTLWIGGGIAIVAIFILSSIAYNQKPADRLKIEIRDIAAVFTAVVVSTTCVYHAMNLRLNLLAHSTKLQFDVDKWEFDKKQKLEDQRRTEETLLLQSQSQRRLLSMEKCLEWYRMADKTGKARQFIVKHKNLLNEQRNSEFIIEIEKETNYEYRSCVIAVLNYFEILSEGILKGLLEEAYVKDIFKTMFLKYLNNLTPYFEVMEKRDGENGIYKSFRKVAESWK